MQRPLGQLRGFAHGRTGRTSLRFDNRTNREHTIAMFQDLRYALRLWTSRPWQAAFAIAALAIGIGANTGVFSVVNALLLRSLPFRDPARLALVRNFIPPHESAK